jgi:Holliday junction resolvase
MITCYQRGYKKEIELVRRLKNSKKYHTVLRSAGSRSPFDIVALSNIKILLIQVKTGKGRFKKEIRRLKRLKVPCSAKKQLWVYNKGWKRVLNC